jgi:2-methylcitrate dehydratase PrpD
VPLLGNRTLSDPSPARPLCYYSAVKITRRLAEFVATTPSSDILPEAREQARRAILDTLGVMLAGSREDASGIAAEMVRDQGGSPDASVFGHGFHAPAAEAALVNGTSAHALDFDDVNMNMRGHPSVPLLPAVLALGEKVGSSGREVVDAFVLGFEVECKLGRVIGAPHYALGWHATSTLGTLAAAAACARLLRLDVERAQVALGIAASLASGVRQNFGTMTKPLHAGWAARNGVIVATLADRGFTADSAALEGESGFLRAASGGARLNSRTVARLSDPWEIVSPGIGVKLYPCCYATHRAIDAALDIVVADGPHHSNIERVVVTVSRGTLMPLQKPLPATGLEGKFSMEYCIAAALADGRIGLTTFTDDAVKRPDLRKLMKRVAVRAERRAAAFPIGGRAVVSVDSFGKINHTRIVETTKGDPQNPLTWNELGGKFRDCAGAILSGSAIDEAIETLAALDEIEDIGRLVSALTPELVHA